MNANELADLIGLCGDGGYNQDAANMLRQQQAEIERLIMLCDCMTTESNRKGNEIEALKQIIDANNLSQNIGQFVKPTNEPVAWINRKGKNGEHGYLEWDKDDEAEINTPLYTHPVKEPLTNEEIEDEWFKVFKPETGIGKNLTNGVYEFAMAILRKAQDNG